MRWIFATTTNILVAFLDETHACEKSCDRQDLRLQVSKPKQSVSSVESNSKWSRAQTQTSRDRTQEKVLLNSSYTAVLIHPYDTSCLHMGHLYPPPIAPASPPLRSHNGPRQEVAWATLLDVLWSLFFKKSGDRLNTFSRILSDRARPTRIPAHWKTGAKLIENEEEATDHTVKATRPWSKKCR